MKYFDIITIFPDSIQPYADSSILGKAQEKRLLKITAHDLRPFSTDKHGKVDDTPYGGGPGMVMTVQPFDAAVKKINRKLKKTCIIMTGASGKKFTQAESKRLAEEYDQFIFMCGRYEGIDDRVRENIADETYSIGDYVLTGGELPALVMTDAISRHITGVLGDPESLKDESHTKEGVLEYPQYTKPEQYSMRRGLKKRLLSVPKVLLSGNHKKIAEWRKRESEKRSKEI